VTVRFTPSARAQFLAALLRRSRPLRRSRLLRVSCRLCRCFHLVRTDAIDTIDAMDDFFGQASALAVQEASFPHFFTNLACRQW
jgi:hypothetical protein